MSYLFNVAIYAAHLKEIVVGNREVKVENLKCTLVNISLKRIVLLICGP